MTFRIAVVQPISHRPAKIKRTSLAVRTVERAVGEGADFGRCAKRPNDAA
jgi:hypothetical protein